jgi:hypothetical protein
MKRTLKSLNCMNYHVSENYTGSYWFAQNGFRSLWTYANLALNKTFRQLCTELIEHGETTMIDKRGGTLTLTMI